MNKEMKKRIQQMAIATWEVIGADFLTLLEENGQPPSMDRDLVIETVCDSSYMLIYGKDIEAYNEWNQLPTYKEKIEVVKPAFTFSKYGW